MALSYINKSQAIFLVTDYGKEFSSNGFGNKMRQWCNDAGLSECSTHGLRKASASILAEAGASEVQLMAIFGWSDSKMAQHYTKAAHSKRIIDVRCEKRKIHLAREKVPLFTNNDFSDIKKGKKYAKKAI